MSDSKINDGKSHRYDNVPKIELTTTSFDNYTLNKNEDTGKESDLSKLKNLFIDPKLEAKSSKTESDAMKNRKNSVLRLPNKTNSVTKSMDFLSINTKTNHLQSTTVPLKDESSATPLNMGFSKSQPNMLRDEDEESVNLQKHISKIFNHALTDAIYSPRDSWLAALFNIYHAIILYISVFLECYSTQLLAQQTKTQRTAWRIVSLIFTIQLCLYFLADVILYPIRKRRHLAMIEAATTVKNKNEKGEIINYKDIKVTKNPLKLYKGFINFSHTMEFLGCLPFFIEEIFPKCRLININHYGLISFLLLCCRLYTCLSIFYYLKNRISKFFHIIIRATKESIYEIISVIILYFIVMVFCSRIIFYADLSKCTLDEASQNWKRQYKNGTINENSLSCELQSNLDAFWYTFMTMTTLGFGDQVVNTYFGKIMATLAFGATPILYTLPSIVITTKMITLIIHDTKNAATKDVAKKHKKRFFSVGQFLTGGVNNRRNRLLKKNTNNPNDSNNQNKGTKEANIDDEDPKKSSKKSKKNRKKDPSLKKSKGKGKEKDKENKRDTKNHDKTSDGRYIVPLRDETSDSNRPENKPKSTLLSVPETKKEEASMTSSIVPLIHGNHFSSIDTKDSKDYSFSNSNSNSNPNSGSNPSSSNPNSRPTSQQDEEEQRNDDILESGTPQLYESPKQKDANTPVLYESPKDYGASELKKAIMDQNNDLFTSGNLTSSMTIKKFYQANPSSVGKPLTSIFENVEPGPMNEEPEEIQPPSSPSASTSHPNLSNPAVDGTKTHPKTTFKSLPVPTSAGSGSNSETENESTIFDYNAYKKNANNRNYIVGMLKQHYQTCLDEIDYVKKREKTLNSLKSGFEKGIMALQTM